MLLREMGTKNFQSAKATKPSARVVETSNMKNSQIFKIKYIYRDIKRVYSEVSASGHLLIRGVSKSKFYQSVNYLHNLCFITPIKKKISIYYTKGPQILLSDGSIVSGELRKRLYGLEVC